MWPELYDFWLWMNKVLSGLEAWCSCLSFSPKLLRQKCWLWHYSLGVGSERRWHHRVNPLWFVSAVPADPRGRAYHRVLCSPDPVSQRDPLWPMGTLKNQTCDQEGPRATSCKPKLHLLQPGFKYPHRMWLGTLPLLIMMRPSRTGILITRELKHSQVLHTWE